MIDRIPVELFRYCATFFSPKSLTRLEATSSGMRERVLEHGYSHHTYGRDLIPHLPGPPTSTGWRILVREKCLMQSPFTPFFTNNIVAARAMLDSGRNAQAIAAVQPCPQEPDDATETWMLLSRGLANAERPQEAEAVAQRLRTQANFEQALRAKDATTVSATLAAGAHVLPPNLLFAVMDLRDSRIVSSMARAVQERAQWPLYSGVIVGVAAGLGDLANVEILLEAGAPKPDHFLTQLLRSESFHDASQFGPFDSAQLKRAWFDVLLSCLDRKLERARVLLQLGADPLQHPPASTTFHSTPLISYSESGNTLMRLVLRGRTNVPQKELLAFLIAHGVDATAVNANGMTALHALVMHPSADTVACAELLIDAGVDVNKRTPDGLTAFALLAANRAHTQATALMHLLLTRGAQN